MATETNGPGIIPYAPELRNEIIAVWEASVRATHDFLQKEDIAFYKTIVESIDFTTLKLHVLRVDEKPAGFIAVAGSKIEMLFLAPVQRGRGHGKNLLDFAVRHLRARSVDVNEQNTRARRFYEANGFRTISRSETDDAGKPYPILNMRLENAAD
jgi:putative acetyltransferase